MVTGNGFHPIPSRVREAETGGRTPLRNDGNVIWWKPGIRACIANTDAQVWYVAAVIVLPDTVVPEINRKIYPFSWTGRFEAVKRRTLTQHPQNKAVLVSSVLKQNCQLESLRCVHLSFKRITDTDAKYGNTLRFTGAGLQLCYVASTRFNSFSVKFRRAFCTR